jgi:hypothetical protein
MAKKTTAGKKTTRRNSGPKANFIFFGCDANNFCATMPTDPHLGKPGSKVYLQATNSDVTITFDGGNSPFKPNVGVIQLKQGQPATRFVVGPIPPGHAEVDYHYKLSCATGCPKLSDDPEMIVP